jgi:molybdopterin-guanine dinucleotide biosynthesis protein A
VKIAGVVLAGGQSKRMGSDKSQLTIDNLTLLEHCQNILKNSNLKKVYISGKQGIKDRYKNIGPIGGISTCLLELKNYDYVVFMPVDMPFLTNKTINQLILNQGHSVVNFEKYNLPVMIKNSSVNRKVLKTQIMNNKLSLYQLFENLKRKVIKNKFNKHEFANINVPKQWQEALNKF